MSTQGASGSGKTTGQLVGLSLVGLSGVLGTTLATQFGLSPWLTAVVALGITLPLAFVLLVVQNLFLRWAPAVSDRVDRLLRRHRKRYLESLHEHVRHLEVLGVATQGEFTLKLGDVYVDVALTPKSAADSRGDSVKRQSLTEVIENSDSGVVAVIGGPGSGKTTLLRHQALSMCAQKRGRLPILLEIRQHIATIIADPEASIADLAASVRAPKAWLESRLRVRDCLVLLDGLDEVADEHDRRLVVQWLRTQIRLFPRNKFVVTSRSYGYDVNPLSMADRVEVQPFTDKQVERFLHAWCEAVERRSVGEDGPATLARARHSAENLLRSLREHEPLLEFVSNPLLLTMIALVHRYRGALPGTRARLYEEMCGVLLHRRREAKGLAISRELSGEQKERVAGVLARAMMERGQRDIRSVDAVDIVRPALARMQPPMSAQEFLREATRSGLLIEPRTGVHAFSHLTLQEYLAAVNIRENGDETLLFDRIQHQWWRETALLWATDADVSPLVDACIRVGTPDAAVLATECIELGRELNQETLARFRKHTRSFDGDMQAKFALGTMLRTARARRVSHLLGPVSKVHLDLLLGEEVVWERGAHGEAVGVPFSVAASLPERLSALLPGEPRFRLPTAAELQSPGARHPGTAAVWADGTSGPDLWCPPSVRHPFQVTRDELAALLRLQFSPSAEFFKYLPEQPAPAYPELLYSYMTAQVSAITALRHLDSSAGQDALAVLRLVSKIHLGTHALRKGLELSVMALSRYGSARHPIFRETFTHALCALAVHELRRTGVITPNEILVLARD